MQLFVRGSRITALDVQACDTVGSALQQLQVCSCDTRISSTAARALGWVPRLLAPHHNSRSSLMALDHSIQACTHTSCCLWCHHYSTVNMSCRPSCLISFFCAVLSAAGSSSTAVLPAARRPAAGCLQDASRVQHPASGHLRAASAHQVRASNTDQPSPPVSHQSSAPMLPCTACV